LLGTLGCDEAERIDHDSVDWSAQWRKRLTAFEVGRSWWIDPHPDRSNEPPADRVRLAIEPRAAFGSGTHESTQLVLMLLEQDGCDGMTVLDVGTGSGVLAVAADGAGAGLVVALDTDPMAAWEARNTASRQSWSCRPHVLAGPVACLGDTRFDLVLCNMIISEFAPLLPRLEGLLAPRGSIVLSGILECERGTVESMLTECRLVPVGEIELRGWIGVKAYRAEDA